MFDRTHRKSFFVGLFVRQSLPVDQAEELLAGLRRRAHGAQHAAGGCASARLLHAAHHHAQVAGLDDHGDALRLQHLGERERDLLGQALLDLQAARKHLGNAGELGEADYAPVGDVADVHLWGLLAGWESG